LVALVLVEAQHDEGDRFGMLRRGYGVISEKVDVRLGGIHGLERVMRDSPADHGSIVEILSGAFRPWRG